jgi:hypothetical protein
MDMHLHQQQQDDAGMAAPPEEVPLQQDGEPADEGFAPPAPLTPPPPPLEVSPEGGQVRCCIYSLYPV